jgi:hypothetical protein
MFDCWAVFVLKANKNPLLSIFGPSENEVDAKGTGEEENGPVNYLETKL